MKRGVDSQGDASSKQTEKKEKFTNDASQIFIEKINEKIKRWRNQGYSYQSHHGLTIKGILTESIKALTTKENVESLFVKLTSNEAAKIYILAAVIEGTLVEPTPLLEEAIKHNNYYFINKLLSLDNAEQQIQKCSSKALGYLILHKNEELLWRFINDENKVNSKIERGESIAAFMINKSPELSILFFQRFGNIIDFNTLSWDKSSLLHFAVRSGFVKLVDFLLDKGLSPFTKNIYGLTPIDYSLFAGNLELAIKLTGESSTTLEQNPKWKKPPPFMNHDALCSKITTYLNLQKNICIDKDIAWALPILDGLCHGWSILASLYVAYSELDPDEAVTRYYEQMQAICQWDEQKDSLLTIPKNLSNEFASLDQLFKCTINEIFCFFQQDEKSFGISRKDREKLLELISNKRRGKTIAEFYLPDLTMDELKMVLSAFQKIASDCVIEISTRYHTVAFYQKTPREIYYFDSNIELQIPSSDTYDSLIDKTHEFLSSNITTISFFHTHAQNITSDLLTEVELIMVNLIETLIFNNPRRCNELDEIFRQATELNAPFFLKFLLSYLEDCYQLKESLVKSMLWSAQKYNLYEVIPILYDKINLDELMDNELAACLKAGILYEIPDLKSKAAAVLTRRNMNKMIPSSTLPLGLLTFQYPPIHSTFDSKLEATSIEKEPLLSCISSNQRILQF